MNLLVCFARVDQARFLADRLGDLADPVSVTVATTLGEAHGLVHQATFDILLVDAPLVDRALAYRRADALTHSSSHRLVLAVHSPSPTLLVRAAHFGFDGIVDHSQPPEEIFTQLDDVLADRSSVQIHPVLRPLDIVPGLFTRTLAFDDDTERHVVDLLGLGLSDRDISIALDITVQAVRNRISRLIRSHGLSTRTQLAALHIRGEDSHPAS